ncbi:MULTISPECIES: hypothetical protein [Thermoanaerobacterium]|uniref:Uncharacterized protein n=3 Tax=Thermoanaerobacterium TaxID=28895 RepID=W9E7I8_9THEO|nr:MULTISPECIES: hypothetical protein [Thermoanaerobacterium]AFK85501.1 hypothetical protein Tsac_0473 [Thermoanaerobacterium saccharolyticum JW/SL-YS485]ETO37448.1 hypothetical protein V518_2397 [Thermoanaerobacterium aotearoense SCUT27]
MLLYLIKEYLKDKLFFAILLINIIYIFINLLNYIWALIKYQMLEIELKKIREKNITNNIYIDFIALVYKFFNFIYIFLSRLIKKSKIRFNIDLIYSIISTIIIFLMSIKVLYGFVYLFIRIILIKITLVKDAYAYFTLTIVLTIVAYFPDKVGLWLQDSLYKFVIKFFKKKTHVLEESLYTSKSIILFLRPKLWVYLISIFITVINSFELISNTTIFINNLWIQIKPIISESVISFIVIDRFINLFKNEYKKIKEEAPKLTNHQ